MIRKAFISALAVFASALLSARSFRDGGSNVNGIRLDSLDVAFVEAFGSYVEGELRSASAAKSAWTTGVRTSAVKHLKNCSFTGSFGFEQMWGQGMAGSMMVRPEYFPVNVYEFTPGNKTRQTYSFSGGVSADIGSNWRIGGKMEFISANYAKRKDLRHTTYLLDMKVSPAVQYHNGRFSAGLAYSFGKVTESVKAEQIGSSTSGYTAFFDKGLYYGVEELWEGSAVHLTEWGSKGLPVLEMTHSLSLQASYGDLYFDFSAGLRHGQAGEKQQVCYRFDGYDLASGVGYRFRTGECEHTLRLGFDFLNQTNNETVLEKVTSGGITTVAEHGSNRIFGRGIFNSSFGYDMSFGLWNAGVSAGFTGKDGVVTLMYPYVMSQKLRIPSVELRGSRRLGDFDISLSARWSNGKMDDGGIRVSESSGVETEPERLERYFAKYREHMTSDKITLVPSVRYRFLKSFYTVGSVNWEHGFGMLLLGSDRVCGTLKVGYNF